MTAKELLEACEDSYIIKSTWTVNGKSIGSHSPEQWNYMRVTLKNKKEFLIPKTEMQKIENWTKLWEVTK